MANIGKLSTEMTSELTAIGTEISKLISGSGKSLKEIADSSGVSVNTLKTVMAGGTCNIISYFLVIYYLKMDFASVMKRVAVAKATPPVSSRITEAEVAADNAAAGKRSPAPFSI